MSGLDLETIAKGLAGVIADGLPGMNAYWYPPMAPQYPNVMVIPAPDFVTYRETFGVAGQVRMSFVLRVQVTSIDPESATSAMYTLLSAGIDEGSIFDVAEAIATGERSPTWGGTVETGALLSASSPAWLTNDNGVDVLEARITAVAYRKKGA